MIVTGKELIERIKDKEYSGDLIKELEKYEVKKTKSVWEFEDGDTCWQLGILDGKFAVYECTWDWATATSTIPGWVHTTKKRAILHARVLNTELAIKKWKRENDNVELDWGNKRQHKNFLTYDYQDGEIRTDWWGTFKYANTIYFSSDSKARQCIDDIGEERIIEWIRWEESDQ